MTKAILFSAMLLVLGVANAEDRFESVAKQMAVDITSANQTIALTKPNSAAKKAAVAVKKIKVPKRNIKLANNTAKSSRIANSIVKKKAATTTLDLLR